MTCHLSWLDDNGDYIGCEDGKGSGDGIDRIHRKILEEDARNDLDGENMNRSNHCYFLRGSIRTNTAKIPTDVVDDEKMEIVHSTMMMIDLDHSILLIRHGVKMTMVDRKVHDDYRSYCHDRRIQSIPHLHNEVETDRCDDRDEVDLLRNELH